MSEEKTVISECDNNTREEFYLKWWKKFWEEGKKLPSGRSANCLPGICSRFWMMPTVWKFWVELGSGLLHISLKCIKCLNLTQILEHFSSTRSEYLLIYKHVNTKENIQKKMFTNVPRRSESELGETFIIERRENAKIFNWMPDDLVWIMLLNYIETRQYL